ncbi:hypothetical protein AB0J90_12280 [Micromonospora sp. NPDC049523]|uniref:hypothetical protein n=1 Tax=Micromonospora sp. NPDC049523 TaxID=3155921 RepID=UPI00342B5568
MEYVQSAEFFPGSRPLRGSAGVPGHGGCPAAPDPSRTGPSRVVPTELVVRESA